MPNSKEVNLDAESPLRNNKTSKKLPSLAPIMFVETADTTYLNARVPELPEPPTHENAREEGFSITNPYRYMGTLYIYALSLLNEVQSINENKLLRGNTSRSHTNMNILKRFTEINKRIDKLYSNKKKSKRGSKQKQ